MSQTVDAAALLDRAYEASTAPIGGLRSYHLEATRSMSPTSGIMNEQTLEIWFSAPDRFRQTVYCGDCPRALTTDTISDGHGTWSVTNVAGRTYALHSNSSSADPQLIVPWESGPADLLRRAKEQSCGTPSLTGEESVAQRSTYVVKVTRQVFDRCATPGAPGQTDTFWIDKATFLPLRVEQHLPQERVGQELVTYTVSTVDYNVVIPDSTYVFTPAAQSTVLGSLGDLKAALGEALQPQGSRP